MLTKSGVIKAKHVKNTLVTEMIRAEAQTVKTYINIKTGRAKVLLRESSQTPHSDAKDQGKVAGLRLYLCS